MPGLSVIVPATDAPPSLGRCVAAIRSGEDLPDELIVVDEPARSGPARARNEGARRASGDVLVFVDADVVVAPDALGRIRSAFADDPGLVALFGSYDDAPAAPGVVSSFRNLLHHHVHHEAAGPATTFWAGLGAVRRDAFLAAGGFDADRYPSPSVEDIELGGRLSRGGARIVLDPGIQGTHLKAWTLAGVVRTDFACRGVPWVALVLERGGGSTALNLGWRHRVTAAATVAAVAGIVARRPAVAAGATVAILVLNRSFYRLLVRRLGLRNAVAGVGLHALHHLVGVAAAVKGGAAHVLAR